MHGASHVVMHQADELEVTSSRKSHGVGIPVHQYARVHARGASVAGSIGSRPRTSHWATRSDLAGGEEGHSMSLGGGKGPPDAVASMHPQLIGQKGQRLYSLVSTLGTHDSLPRCGPTRLWNDKNSQHEQPAGES